jgi:DNA/RNA endonuclease G (NUC1)
MVESVFVVLYNEDPKVATEVFYRVVGEKEDAAQKRDKHVREDELDESKSVCGVQDG